MITINLDRKDLENLIKGSSPNMTFWDYNLFKKAGFSYSDQYGKIIWSNLDNLTDEELIELYKFCRK